MLIIVDKKIAEEAKRRLSKIGNLLELETSGITYPAISGHPDIFFTQIGKKLIVAPNLPEKYFSILQEKKTDLLIGENHVGKVYPKTASYNAVVTNSYLFHNLKITETSILHHAKQLKFIQVNQGYTRCNLVFLDENTAITSDKGIAKNVAHHGLKGLYVDPKGIRLPGFDHGFFGGCCGILGNKLFLLGSLKKHTEGEKVKAFVETLDWEIVELSDQELFDGGGIFFIE